MGIQKIERPSSTWFEVWSDGIETRLLRAKMLCPDGKLRNSLKIGTPHWTNKGQFIPAAVSVNTLTVAGWFLLDELDPNQVLMFEINPKGKNAKAFVIAAARAEEAGKPTSQEPDKSQEQLNQTRARSEDLERIEKLKQTEHVTEIVSDDWIGKMIKGE